MTVKEYIGTKLTSLSLTDADFANYAIETGVNLDDEYGAENQEVVNKGMTGLIESVMFSPRLKSISESGFSMSYDYADLGKYYMWLCRKYGIKPNDEVAAMLGISMIIDRTHDW
ncbi:MAG: hypothetical protein KBT34_05445 [Prevotella sp.]|nr:hypothetical protein [Candidatus Prevotella equi]